MSEQPNSITFQVLDEQGQAYVGKVRIIMRGINLSHAQEPKHWSIYHPTTDDSGLLVEEFRPQDVGAVYAYLVIPDETAIELRGVEPPGHGGRSLLNLLFGDLMWLEAPTFTITEEPQRIEPIIWRVSPTLYALKHKNPSEKPAEV